MLETKYILNTSAHTTAPEFFVICLVLLAAMIVFAAGILFVEYLAKLYWQRQYRLKAEHIARMKRREVTMAEIDEAYIQFITRSKSHK
jgi:hypothetical protein